MRSIETLYGEADDKASSAMGHGRMVNLSLMSTTLMLEEMYVPQIQDITLLHTRNIAVVRTRRRYARAAVQRYWPSIRHSEWLLYGQTGMSASTCV